MTVSLEHGGFGSHPKENETGRFFVVVFGVGRRGRGGAGGGGGARRKQTLLPQTYDARLFFFFNPVAWRVQKSEQGW